MPLTWTPDDFDRVHKEAIAEIHDTIQKHSEVIGAKGFDPETGLIHAIPNQILTDWVFIGNMAAMDDGDAYIARLCPENMLTHSRDGLLFRALYAMED